MLLHAYLRMWLYNSECIYIASHVVVDHYMCDHCVCILHVFNFWLHKHIIIYTYVCIM